MAGEKRTIIREQSKGAEDLKLKKCSEIASDYVVQLTLQLNKGCAGGGGRGWGELEKLH